MGETLYDTVLFTDFVSTSVSFESALKYVVTEDNYQVLKFVPAQLVGGISQYRTRDDYQEVLMWASLTLHVYRIREPLRRISVGSPFYAKFQCCPGIPIDDCLEPRAVPSRER